MKLNKYIFIHILDLEKTDGVNSWENTIDVSDAYYKDTSDAYHLQYHSHSTSTAPAKIIKTPEKSYPVDKEKWKLHKKETKSRYSFSESFDDSTIRDNSLEHKPNNYKKPGFEYEYPNVVPYNQILLPKSFYVKDKLSRKSDKSKRVLKVSPARKNKRKKKNLLKRIRKNKSLSSSVKSNGKSRTGKQSRLRRAKKSSKNPIKNFFRGIYYKYFSQKDRQIDLAPDVYPVSKAFS